MGKDFFVCTIKYYFTLYILSVIVTIAWEEQNMTSEKTITKTHRPQGLKMQELVAATGVPKSTILHYLNRGLLPGPIKTSRNMAYYDPACVERITFIKMMQSKYRLPLKVIEKMLKEPQELWELEPVMQLRAAIFGRPESDELLDLEDFCRATGLVPDEVAAWRAVRLLQPLEEDRFDQEDVAVGRVLKKALNLGVSPEECTFYPRLAEKIVDEEMALRQRFTEALPVTENAAVTLELTRGARVLRNYIIDRVFQWRIIAMGGLKKPEES
jgi:DNA-binding transcriptional MerR regulator